MLNIKLICTGKMKEGHYISAFGEYAKRLSSHCRFDNIELPEARLPKEPSQKEILSALEKEASEVRKHIQSGEYVIALCVEGKELSSPELAGLFEKCAGAGKSSLCFLIGSSFGLDKSLKMEADLQLSMSKMTFPHHLARVMLAEQIYRGIMIGKGSKYHK